MATESSRLKVLNRDFDQRKHVALMSLPAHFSTELHTVPNHVPYLKASQPCPSNLSLELPPGGINVAVVWASNPDNKAMYRNKSMPLDLIMPLFSDLFEIRSDKSSFSAVWERFRRAQALAWS